MSAPPLFALEDLRVAYGGRAVVDGVSLVVAPGETLAIVGASGSGKSQTMLAALRLLPPQAEVAGRVLFEGSDLLTAPRKRLDGIRGRGVAMIFQEPASALDPLYTVGSQIGAVLRFKRGFSRAAATRRAAELLDLVGVKDAATRCAAYPHQLSGGQRQRVAIAMALAAEPGLIIADEPTTALDASVAARIVDLLAGLRARQNLALIVISHDLDLARRLADRVHVMEAGRIVENGPAALLGAPRSAAARGLVSADPPPRAPHAAARGEAVLTVDTLCVRVRRPGLFGGSSPLIENISLAVAAGRTLGVVGESGAGKTTLGRALLRLVASSGTIRFEGRDISALGAAALRPLRRRMQMVFQDPYGALSPRMRVGDIVAEGLRIHEPRLSPGARRAMAQAALAEVGVDPRHAGRLARDFSGGQRQRIAIARAMILRPRLVVLDEPTSALDRAIAADVLALLAALQAAHGLAYVLISHDLAVVRAMADEIAVMKDGRIVEQGAAADILERPREPYARALVAAALKPKGA